MTVQEYKDVIILHKEGFTYRQIAEKFKVNMSSVREIIKKDEEKKLLKEIKKKLLKEIIIKLFYI